MPFKSIRITLATLLLSHAAQISAGPPRFEDRAGALGISHSWGENVFNGDLGGGVAIDDLDRDGDADVVLATKLPNPLLFFEQVDGIFIDSTAKFGLANLFDIKQILVADLNDDGFRDLLLTAWGAPPRLFENTGSAFIDRTEGSGIEPEISTEFPGLGTGAAAADMDHDGDLDIYMSFWKLGQPGPEASNALYRNDGNLQFVEIAQSQGVDSPKKSYQVVFTDLTEDGWPDILVAQDKGGGLDFWRNDRSGNFEFYSTQSGLTGVESEQSTLIDGMGIAVGDYDGDLRPDVYATNIANGNVLYRASESGVFDEVAIPSGTQMNRFCWGTSFLDADQDGWLDLYVGNFTPKADALFRNRGDGSFVNIGAASQVAGNRSTLGLAVGDLDADGDLDVITSHVETPTRVIVNVTTEPGHWLQVDLAGSTSNRDGVGAIVFATADGRTQRRDRMAGISYLSSNPSWLHFGLDDATMISRLEIRWPSGIVDTHLDVAADARYVAEEGGALVAYDAEPLEEPGDRLLLRGSNPRANRDEPVRFCTAGDGLAAGTRLSIYDSRGRLVRTVAGSMGGAGEMCFDWEPGDEVVSGVYYVRVDGADRSSTVTLIR